MAETGNKITITLSAYDMFNMLATLEEVYRITGFPNPDIRDSYNSFKINVLMNASSDAMTEAMAELKTKEVLKEIFEENGKQ